MKNGLQTILVLEDDPLIREEVCELLNYEAYRVLSAGNATTFIKLMSENTVDLFLIDLVLPDANGLSLVKNIRSNSSSGIIILSGKTGETDRVVGLEVGADDYVTKPFSARELCARVSSVLRRSATPNTTPLEANEQPIQTENIIKFDNWTMNVVSRRVLNQMNVEIELTKTEFDLLYVFLTNRNIVLSRDDLIHHIRGRDWAGYDRAMDGLVSRLRKKIKPRSDTRSYIKTIHGLGYLFP